MIQNATDKLQREQCMDIRKEVFVKEQGVDINKEVDEYEDYCQHFILYHHDIPAGTVRYRKLDDQTIKLERMAVLKEYRSFGYGKSLIEFAEDHAKQNGYSYITLNGQSHALGFYEKMGYEKMGEEFMEENIPHYKMKKTL